LAAKKRAKTAAEQMDAAMSATSMIDAIAVWRHPDPIIHFNINQF
jgi:hypothetical protein